MDTEAVGAGPAFDAVALQERSQEGGQTGNPRRRSALQLFLERGDARVGRDSEPARQVAQVGRPNGEQARDERLGHVGWRLAAEAHGAVAEQDPGDDCLGQAVGGGAGGAQQPRQLGAGPRAVRHEVGRCGERRRLGKRVDVDAGDRRPGGDGLLDLRQGGANRERRQPRLLLRGRARDLVLAARPVGQRAVGDQAEARECQDQAEQQHAAEAGHGAHHASAPVGDLSADCQPRYPRKTRGRKSVRPGQAAMRARPATSTKR